MEKIFKKMFDEAIRCLDWDVIMSFYDSNDYESAYFKKRRGRGGITKDSIRKELRNLVDFVLTNDISRFEAEQWIIISKKNEGDLGGMLEIIFAPTKSCAFEKEDDYPTEEEINQDAYEVEVLQELLDKSVREENYELSAVLRDRINKIKKANKQMVKVLR